jgi:outer membrane biosynthesis protein TonB
MARVRFLGPEQVIVPELGGRAVEPDEVVEVPDHRYGGYVCQTTLWEGVEEPQGWEEPEPPEPAEPPTEAVQPVAQAEIVEPQPKSEPAAAPVEPAPAVEPAPRTPAKKTAARPQREG